MHSRYDVLRIISLGCIVLAIASCSPSPASPISPGEANTWIDAPLDNSRFPLAPVTFQAHASSPHGLMEIEYRIDGTLIASHALIADADELAYDEHSWEPESAGSYLLQVRAQGADETWSEAPAVRFDVGDPTPTVDIEPEATEPVPEPSSTPETAVILQPPTFTPAVFHFQGRDCPQQSAVIQIRVNPPDAVYNMILFLRFSDAAAGYDSGWDAGHSMSPEGGGSYRYVITSEGLPDFSNDVNLIVHTQFVGTNAAGEQMVRSPVYTELRLTSRCSE